MQTLSPEMFWLVLTILMPALFWIPYILMQLVEVGPWKAVTAPQNDPQLRTDWAARCKRAHTNAVENLVVFAPLVIALQFAGISTALTAGACGTYFFARLAHYVIYALGVPVLRTITFAIGVAVQIVLALTLLGAM